MEIKASAKYLRISPRKLRFLTGGLVGLSAKKALEKLEFYPQRGTEFLIKVIKQAIANATANFKQAEDCLKIKKIEVGEGPRFKRMDKSHGARFDRGIIKKKTAHLYLILEAKETSSVSPNRRVTEGKGKKVEKTEVIKEGAEEKVNPLLPKLPPSLKLRRTSRRTNGTKS